MIRGREFRQKIAGKKITHRLAHIHEYSLVILNVNAGFVIKAMKILLKK